VADDVVFFGGTALTRTHLPDLRLSEDIDLIALGDRGATAAAIQRAVVKRHGPFTSPESISFDGIPSEEEWTAALAHQCRPKVSASEAASVVQAAWSSV
jgi:hypothetical protein